MEVKEGNEVIVSIDDFKLIKSFYPEFTRKQVESNAFIIGWSELMPVVEKIENIGFRFSIQNRFTDIRADTYFGNYPSFASAGHTSKIQIVYDTVLKFIHWYNSIKKA